MKHIKLFENFLNEAKEPRDEVDHKVLRKYLRSLNKVSSNGGSVGDKEAYNILIKSKGKKLALGDFMDFEKPSTGEMDELAETLKKLEIGIYDESWVNFMDHPQKIIGVDKYFISKNFITLDQLKKMPDVASTIANNIKSDPTTWNQKIYNEIGAGKKLTNGELGDVIRALSLGGK